MPDTDSAHSDVALGEPATTDDEGMMMDRSQLERYFTDAIRDDRTPALVIDAQFPQLADSVISAVRETVASIGATVTPEDVASGIRSVASVEVVSTSNPGAVAALHAARQEMRGVILVHASHDASSEAERVFHLAQA